MNLSHLPLRTAIGAFFINSGASKWNLEGEAAEGMHGMAVNAIPAMKRFNPPIFARLLAGSEIAIGAALVLPVIPSALAGLGLLGFSAGLMRIYWVTPGLHNPGDPRPTQHGVPLAKDLWLVGAALTLIVGDFANRGRRLGRRAR